MKKDRIPDELKQQVERELLSGEELLWLGQPAPLRLALRKTSEFSPTWSRILTGVLLTLTLLTYLYSGLNNSASAVWIATFLLVLTLFAAVISDLVERFRHARRTVYAVTNRRAFTHSPRGICSHMPDDLKSIERVNHTKQMGDVIFGHKSHRRMIWMFMSVRESEPIGFFNIRYPDQVEALLLETFHKGEVFTASVPKPQEESTVIKEDQLTPAEKTEIPQVLSSEA